MHSPPQRHRVSWIFTLLVIFPQAKFIKFAKKRSTCAWTQTKYLRHFLVLVLPVGISFTNQRKQYPASRDHTFAVWIGSRLLFACQLTLWKCLQGMECARMYKIIIIIISWNVTIFSCSQNVFYSFKTFPARMNYYVGKWFWQYKYKFQVFKRLELFKKTLKKFKSLVNNYFRYLVDMQCNANLLVTEVNFLLCYRSEG